MDMSVSFWGDRGCPGEGRGVGVIRTLWKALHCSHGHLICPWHLLQRALI